MGWGASTMYVVYECKIDDCDLTQGPRYGTMLNYDTSVVVW